MYIHCYSLHTYCHIVRCTANVLVNCDWDYYFQIAEANALAGFIAEQFGSAEPEPAKPADVQAVETFFIGLSSQLAVICNNWSGICVIIDLGASERKAPKFRLSLSNNVCWK